MSNLGPPVAVEQEYVVGWPNGKFLRYHVTGTATRVPTAASAQRFTLFAAERAVDHLPGATIHPLVFT